MPRRNPKDWYDEDYSARLFSMAGFPTRIRRGVGGTFSREVIEFLPSSNRHYFVYWDDNWEPAVEEDPVGNSPITPSYTVEVYGKGTDLKGARYDLNAGWDRLERGVYVEVDTNILRDKTAAEIVDYIRHAPTPWEEL